MSTKIAISQFKSHCLAIIEKLQINQQPIIITKRNKEIAQVLPINTDKVQLFGIFKNRAEIKDDILEPIQEKWDAENE